MTTRAATYKRKAIREDDFVFVSPSVVAVEYRKNPTTIFRWIQTGYVFSLGWKLRKVPVNRWLIGIPVEQFSAFREQTLTMLS